MKLAPRNLLAIALLLLALGVATILGLWRNYSNGSKETRNSSIAALAPDYWVLLLDSASSTYSQHLKNAEAGLKLGLAEMNNSNSLGAKVIDFKIVKPDAQVDTSRVLFALSVGGLEEQAAAANWAISSKIPVMLLNDGPCITLEEQSKSVVSQYIWSLGLSWESSIEPLLIHLNEKYSRPDKTLSIFYVGGDLLENQALLNFTRDAAEGLGFATVDQKFFDIRLADYYTALRNIISRAPDLLFLVNPGAGGIRFMEQAHKLGLTKGMVVSGFSTFDSDFFAQENIALNDVYTIGRYSRFLPEQANQKFIELLKSYQLAETFLNSSTFVSAFTATKLVASALKGAGAISPQTLANQLGQTEVIGPQGLVRLNKDNHILEQPLLVLQHRQGSWQLVESVGTAVHPRLLGCTVPAQFLNR